MRLSGCARTNVGKRHLTQQLLRGVSQAAKRAELRLRDKQHGAFLQYHTDLKAATKAKADADAQQV